MSSRPLPRPVSNDPSLAYYRELEGHPVLDRETELEHARVLQSARDAFAAVAESLPAEIRSLVLAGNEQVVATPRRWPLADLDACYHRLLAATRNRRALNTLTRDARRHKRRIDRAREALVLGNLRLVPLIVNRSGFHPAAFLDLVQEGNIGLIEAIDRFEPERGLRFGTYAQWWIRRAILRSVADVRRMITIPVHTAKLIRELDAVTAKLRDELGHEPGDCDVANQMDTTLSRVRQLRTIVPQVCPLEAGGAEDGGMSLLQRLPDEAAADPLEDMIGSELTMAITDAIGQLKPREQRVVRLRFGLGKQARTSLREIGELLGISRERVRQIEENALRKVTARLLQDSTQAPNCEEQTRRGPARRSRLREAYAG